MKCQPGCMCGKHRKAAPPDSADGPETQPEPEPLKMIYHDRGHLYYLNGKRTKSVSAVAKIAADDYKIRMWHERMIALGVTMDPNLRENIAMHADNNDMLETLAEDAKKIAKAHLPADRGSQKHRVLELVLLGQEDRLITDQQRADAVILKRTLDRYRLTPRTDLAEQFVVYPEYMITGRFDAVLGFETADGRTVLVDLKSGENAVKYPHSTSAQLAMYDNAPLISVGENRGSRIEVTKWGTMPANLDHDVAYVLLVTNDEQVGTLHEIDIRHGWKAAQMAMDLIVWRKQFNYGNGIVHEVKDRYAEAVDIAATENELRDIWKQAAQNYALDERLKQAIMDRRDALTVGVNDVETQEDTGT